MPCEIVKLRSLWAFGNFFYDLGAQKAGGAVVHLGELRCDPGLKREASQDG